MSLESTETSSLHPRPQLFVADDDPDVRRVLVGFLAHCGCDVLGLADGQALLEQVERDPSACAGVVMDAQMPGPSLADRVRRLRALRAELPIIVVTGDPLPASDLAADGDLIVLGKPFGRAALRQALSAAGAREAA